MDNDWHELYERVAVLETRLNDLDEIKGKLDELLHLKSKGAGALWLVSLVIGSAIVGLFSNIVQFFNRPHL